MKGSDDLLNEFAQPGNESNRSYLAMIYGSALYIILNMFDLVFDLRNLSFTVTYFDWTVLAAVVLPALAGFLLCLKRFIIGWIISLFYYGIVMCMVTTTVSKDLWERGLAINYFIRGYRVLPLLFLPPAIFLLLAVKSTRKYLKISKLSFSVVLVVTLFIGIALAYSAVLT